MREHLTTILRELAKLLPAIRKGQKLRDKLTTLEIERAKRRGIVDDMVRDVEDFDGASGKPWPGKGPAPKEDEDTE